MLFFVAKYNNFFKIFLGIKNINFKKNIINISILAALTSCNQTKPNLTDDFFSTWNNIDYKIYNISCTNFRTTKNAPYTYKINNINGKVEMIFTKNTIKTKRVYFIEESYYVSTDEKYLSKGYPVYKSITYADENGLCIEINDYQELKEQKRFFANRNIKNFDFIFNQTDEELFSSDEANEFVKKKDELYIFNTTTNFSNNLVQLAYANKSQTKIGLKSINNAYATYAFQYSLDLEKTNSFDLFDRSPLFSDSFTADYEIPFNELHKINLYNNNEYTNKLITDLYKY